MPKEPAQIQPEATHSAVTVAISTMGARAADIPLPAPLPALTYLILVQAPPTPLPDYGRADVTVLPLEGRGLSASRNAALDHCKTPYLLFSDDDLILHIDGIQSLATALDTDPDLDLAVGWRSRSTPLPRAHRLRWFNAGHVCAPEFMLRHEAAMGTDPIRFDTNFGVGARHPIGEDYIFVCDVLGAGSKGLCLPVTTGDHIGPSSGDDWNSPRLIAARKAMLSRCFGRWALPVRTAYALKHMRHLGGVRAALRFALP